MTLALSVIGLAAILPIAIVWISPTVNARLEKNIEIYEISRQNKAPFLVPASNPKINNPSEYRYWGEVVTEGSYLFTEEFAQAKRQYSNLLSCVPSTAMDGANLDISYFRWPHFRNKSEVQLCLFYVADVLQSVEKMQEWVNSQNFAVEFYTGVSAGVPHDENASRIYALERIGWDRRGPIEDHIVFRLIRSAIKPLYGSLYFDEHIGFSINYSGDGVIFSVNAVSRGL